MKNMKKRLALILAVALAAAALTALPAAAESGTDAVSSATPGSAPQTQSPDSNGKDGRAPGSAPQTQSPDSNGQNSRMPGSAPQTQSPDSNGQNSRMPGRNAPRNSGSGTRHARGADRDTRIFDELLSAGVITQETYDAVMQYLQEKAQAGTDAPQEAEAQPAAESPAVDLTALLDSLLASGAITQEVHDLLTTAMAR